MKRIKLTLTLVLFIAPIAKAQDLPSYIPTDGLVAYYPFNGNANDESGNGHHATVNGAILSSDRDGNNDKAYEFSHDGASFGNNHQSIYIPFHSDFQSENFTVSIWFKADSYGWDGNSKIESTLFSKREDSYQANQATYRIQLSSNFIRSGIGGPDGDNLPGCDTNSDQPILGAWYHAASTFDGATLKQYVNGVKVSETDCDLSHNDISTSGIMLGQTWQGNGYWYHLDGKLDEFLVYNKAMTEQEMENYYVSATSDILLNGVVSAENHQIKNVADPTDAQDAVTKSYFESNRLLVPNKNIEQILSVGNDANGKQLKGLADPTDAQDAVTLSILFNKIEALQDQIDALQASSGSGTVTDQDGNSYPYLTYGNQVWTVKNAEVVTYRDGTPIPHVTDAKEWANLTTGAWCYYDNDPTKGKLYNWYAVAGIHDNDENTPNKEFAPEGWHVPSSAEWTELENYLIANGYNYDDTTTENKIAKAMASKSGWTTWTGEGAIGNDLSLNNSSGFNAVPGGSILGDVFSGYGSEARFWTSTYFGSNNLYHKRMDYRFSFIYSHNEGATLASSIRFVKD